MTDWVADAIGWLGAASLLMAYALVSGGRVDGRGASFQLMNLTGAIGLAVNGIHHHAWPSAGLNVVWIVIGLWAVTTRSSQPLRRPHRPDSRRTAPPPSLGATRNSQPQEKE